MGNTASHVQGPKVGPALATGCVWMGPTGPECVSVTKVSMGLHVKHVRAADTESTVIRVGLPPPLCHMTPPPICLTHSFCVQTVAVRMVSAEKVSVVTARVSVTWAGEESSVKKV